MTFNEITNRWFSIKDFSFKGIIDEYNPDKVFAFATSAIRSATNGKKFVTEVKRKTGLTVKIIGERLARAVELRVAQRARIVFDPAWLRIDLRDFLLSKTDDLAVGIEHQCA